MERNVLIQAMKHSISEVLETMFFLPVECFDSIATETLWSEEEDRPTVALLNFYGPFSGSFYLLVPQGLALYLTAKFLGSEAADISQDHVEETAKELVNMIAGNTFTIFDDRVTFDLGIPKWIPHDQVKPASNPENDIFIEIRALENSLAVRMVLDD